MPYVAMAMSYGNLNQVGQAAENAGKAFELRTKVSEREEYNIEATYYLNTTGELEKAAQAYGLWQASYPKDDLPHTNLAFIYAGLGYWQKAADEAREAMQRDPSNELNYLNLAAAYESLNRFDEARAVCEQAEKHNLSSEQLTLLRYQLAFLTGIPSRWPRQ